MKYMDAQITWNLKETCHKQPIISDIPFRPIVFFEKDNNKEILRSIEIFNLNINGNQSESKIYCPTLLNCPEIIYKGAKFKLCKVCMDTDGKYKLKEIAKGYIK